MDCVTKATRVKVQINLVQLNCRLFILIIEDQFPVLFRQRTFKNYFFYDFKTMSCHTIFVIVAKRYNNQRRFYSSCEMRLKNVNQQQPHCVTF